MHTVTVRLENSVHYAEAKICRPVEAEGLVYVIGLLARALREREEGDPCLDDNFSLTVTA